MSSDHWGSLMFYDPPSPIQETTLGASLGIHMEVYWPSDVLLCLILTSKPDMLEDVLEPHI